MQNILASAVPANGPGDIQQADYIDFIGNFALGVGNVKKQHVVVVIHVGGHGIVQKLNRTGAKVIGIDHREAGQATPIHAPGQDRRMAARGDAEGFVLPIEPCSVDIVFVDLALHQAQTPSLAIMEIKRILKPGGRLVITDIDKYSDSEPQVARRNRWVGFYPGDIRHWMKLAGFSNIIVNPVPTRKVCSVGACPDHTKQGGYLMATGTA